LGGNFIPLAFAISAAICSRVESLIRECIGLSQLCVEVAALHISQIEPDLPEFADFVWCKAC
jgi:hypothetical protein